MSGAGLGKDYGFCVRADVDKSDFASLSKWDLQSAACRLLPHSRVTGCHRIMSDKSKGVTVRADKAKAWYSGVAICGKVWICPVCARKIAEKRRDEVQEAIDKCIGQGGDVALLTFTFSHTIYHQLDDLLPRMTEALRKLKSGRAWKELKAEYGILGMVRNLEVTHGRNGWHPHAHEIEFFKTPLSHEQRGRLQEALFFLWHSACKKAGLPLPNREHGVDVRGATKAAQYVSKWGFASELTRPASKQGWAGRTPFSLLEDYALGDELAGDLFVEFAKAFHGRRQLVWSRGLRDYLELGELFSDEEIAELEPENKDDKPSDVITLNCFQWALVCRNESRGVLLELAMKGRRAVEEWLAKLRGAGRISRRELAPSVATVTGYDARSVGNVENFAGLDEDYAWFETNGGNWPGFASVRRAQLK